MCSSDLVVVVGYTFLDEGEYIGAVDPALGSLLPPADEPHVVESFREFVERQPRTTHPERMKDRPRGFAAGGDRSSLRLLDHDVALIRAVAAANPRTVVVVQAGSAVVMSEWDRDVPAIAQAWYGGCEAGAGLADVLVGAVDPSGRLPFSVPADESNLPLFDRDATTFRYDRWHGWWHLARTGRAAAYPFGFGLSYTTFEVGDVDVQLTADAIAVTGTVRNTGGRDGVDVVQVCAELPGDDAPARLVGFARVEVGAGGAARFAVQVPLDRLARRDPVAHAWSAPTGLHRVVVRRHADDPTAVAVTVDLS